MVVRVEQRATSWLPCLVRVSKFIGRLSADVSKSITTPSQIFEFRSYMAQLSAPIPMLAYRQAVTRTTSIIASGWLNQLIRVREYIGMDRMVLFSRVYLTPSLPKKPNPPLAIKVSVYAAVFLIQMRINFATAE